MRRPETKQPRVYYEEPRESPSLAVEVSLEAVASCFQRIIYLIFVEKSSELLLKLVSFIV